MQNLFIAIVHTVGTKSSKKRLLLLFSIATFFYGHSQTVSIVSGLDSSFPVTDNYFEPSYNYTSTNHAPTEVYKVLSNKGKYYFIGNFTNLSNNQGSALILDTATKAIKSSPKWPVNGLIKASIPDGMGGFYIGGFFNKIGDSVRNYIAHIDSTGKPLYWNASANDQVDALYKRNDTLFIAGRFTSFSNQTRGAFVMYKLSGDYLLPWAGAGEIFLSTREINAFLVKNDTIVFRVAASQSYTGLKKYNFRNNTFLPWQTAVPDFDNITSLQFDKDSTTIICATEGSPILIKGLRYDNAAQRYQIECSIYYSFQPNNGSISGLKVVGNKCYAVGHFEYAGGAYLKGFVSFDAVSGVLFSNNLLSDGHCDFVDSKDGQLFVSGKFTTIKNVPRNNFVSVDTAGLTVNNWELSPTDEILNMCYSGRNLLVAGNFNGLNSNHRNGFAAVDSATGTLLPWNPVPPQLLQGCKKAMIRGDTLFVLGTTTSSYSCSAGYAPQLVLYNINTGLRLNDPFVSCCSFACCRIDDFLIDSNFLYVLSDGLIKRYFLPSLAQDQTWMVYNNYVSTPTVLLLYQNKILAAADNRCISNSDIMGYIYLYPKSGSPYNGMVTYSYKGLTPYEVIKFEHGLVAGNKVYLQGEFTYLNGSLRSNFACINLDNGSVTNWQPPFANTTLSVSGFRTTSELKMFNGRIYFGSYGRALLSNGMPFLGFGSMDTISGAVYAPPLIKAKTRQANESFDAFYKFANVNDFALSNDKIVVVGGFDSILSIGAPSIAGFKLLVTPPLVFRFIGSGNWSNPTNWSNAQMPPSVLLPGDEIIVDPPGNDECVLDIPQTISPAAKLTIAAGKRFRVLGSMLVQ